MNNFYTFNEIELLHKIKEHDAAAFTELYNRYWESLYNSAYKRVQIEAPCQDIVQDVFTDIWKRRAEIEIENVAAYLHTAVRFQVLKYFAKNKLSTHFVQPFENIIDASLRADCKINERDLYLLVKSWMDTLPKKRQNIYNLRINENLSTKEIASRLSISQKTVQNQLGTTLRSLRSKLAHLFLFFL